MITDRISGDVPITDVTTALSNITHDGTVAVSGFGSVGYPKELPIAIQKSDREFHLTIISGGSVGAEIDEALVDRSFVDRRYPYQAQAASRQAINEGRLHFHDHHVSDLGDLVASNQPAEVTMAIVEAVAVGTGWFIPTMSIGPTPEYVNAADHVIVELNESQPLALQNLHDIYQSDMPPNREPIPLTDPGGRIGGPKVPFDPEKLVAVVRSERSDSPYEFNSPTDANEAIAENLASFLLEESNRNPYLSERITLQFGVGSLGNALMGAFKSVDFGDRDVAYFGEVIQDGLLDMIDSGKLESASAASLALSSEGQTQLFDNLDRYSDYIVLRPSDVSNNAELISRFGVIGVNSALEVDLSGHANSTHINGTHLMNGIGGSGDFSRNSLISVIALESTARNGDISRIVPMVPHVDHTEHDFSIVVTEQGLADLRGLDPRERASELIENCAHPSYKDDLWAYLDRSETKGGHIPHDLDTALDWPASRQ